MSSPAELEQSETNLHGLEESGSDGGQVRRVQRLPVFRGLRKTSACLQGSCSMLEVPGRSICEGISEASGNSGTREVGIFLLWVLRKDLTVRGL